MYEVLIWTAAGSQVIEFEPAQIWEMMELIEVLDKRAVTYIARTDRVIVASQGANS